MLDPASLSVFVAASLALLLMPGPAVLYIIARSLNQGRGAGLVSVLGIGLGSLVHVLAAAIGLSALLMSSALAFSVVKYLGAAYLFVLGVRTLRHSAGPEHAAVRRDSLRRIFSQGVIVNVLNPKTALFFFAFLPQFVDPARGPVAVQVLLLGVLFGSMAICTDSMYALLAGTLGQRLAHSARFWEVRRSLAGSVYLVLGVATALAGSETH